MSRGTFFLSMCAAAVTLGAWPIAAQIPPAGRPPLQIGWTPKKTPYNAYTAPNRAWWKLSDVLAMHKSEKTWSQPIWGRAHWFG